MRQVAPRGAIVRKVSKKAAARPARASSPGGVAREGSTIRVVARRTGLGMDTLRAWERRFGWPSPERRPGSNRRLYSARDVERLVAVARALQSGYRVGDVIDKDLPELAALAKPPDILHLPEGSRGLGDVSHWIELLQREDVTGLEAELRQAGAALGAKRFVTELAHPFAVEVGIAWQKGRLAVRHEHLATECLTTQIRHLLAAYQDLEARPVVLLATLPGELHTLALQMVALYLAVSSAKPRLLGASTPPEQIAGAARGLHADVVGVTVTTSADLRSTRANLRTLRAALPERVAIWVGGNGAEALGLDGRGLRIVSSWAAIDDALSALRDAR